MRRLRDIGDARSELEEARAIPAAAPATQPRTRPVRTDGRRRSGPSRRQHRRRASWMSAAGTRRRRTRSRTRVSPASRTSRGPNAAPRFRLTAASSRFEQIATGRWTSGLARSAREVRESHERNRRRIRDRHAQLRFLGRRLRGLAQWRRRPTLPADADDGRNAAAVSRRQHGHGVLVSRRQTGGLPPPGRRRLDVHRRCHRRKCAPDFSESRRA